jgi:beta-exotoxin I transport system ATP-binding protein
MNYVIKTNQLSKTYKGHKVVDRVNIEVPAGSVYGYLGANGAGKTTTIRMLLNLVKPDNGSIEIFGLKIPKLFTGIAHRIGVVPGEVTIYEELTGYEILDYFQGFLKEKAVLKEQLLFDFKLNDRDLNKKVRHYSQGMKQKILLVQAMQHDPDLLFLDEASEKLDPLMQNIFYQYIRDFKNRGKTVFLSSHNLPEVEKVCDKIGIIKDGRLLIQDNIENLKKDLPRMVKITFNETVNLNDFKVESIRIVKSIDNQLDLKIKGPLEPLLKILKKYKTHNLEIPESPLESYFMEFYKTDEKV